MNRRCLIVAAVAVAGTSLFGCANMDTVRNAPLNAGERRDFAAPYDRVNAATLRALSAMNVNIVSSAENEQGMTYLFSQAMQAFSWGEVGRVIVQKSTAPQTTVYVTWEKRSQFQLTGTGQSEFSRLFFSQVQSGL